MDSNDKQPEKCAATDTSDAGPSKKAKDRFRYGNYNRYYGSRNKGLDRDPRLDLLPKEWFKRRAVLDIGCNVGHLTISIAKDFQPGYILGIDIDEHLIGTARKNIRHYCDEETRLIGKFPASLAPEAKKSKRDAPAEDELTPKVFPNNVWFLRENYVLDEDSFLDMVKAEYDVILALSIAKWIHLNWGDDGIKRFFRRIFKHLKPGGKLILEPQDITTYGKRSRLNEEMHQNYRNMIFKPEHFNEYLLSNKVGFERMEELGIPKATSKGFERPLLVFHKAVYQPLAIDKEELKRRKAAEDPMT